MNRTAILQFQRLPPEAQRAALWRLAWSGLTIEQMAERTGWSVDLVRRKIDEESSQFSPTWQAMQSWTAARQSLPA
jgi:DNA-directed RNA polymerase specialized sigma24 family protein